MNEKVLVYCEKSLSEFSPNHYVFKKLKLKNAVLVSNIAYKSLPIYILNIIV